MAKKAKKEVVDRPYKKGTKVVIHTSCNYVGCDSRQTITLEDDYSADELNNMAWEMALEEVAPEGWFEMPEEDEE